MRNIIIALILTLDAGLAIGQNDLLEKKNKQFYFSWGYTKALFSKSTIHFKNTSMKQNEYRGKPDNYDFTIYDVNASEDRKSVV